LDLDHGATQIGTFETTADNDEALEILRTDLVLRRELGDLREGAERRDMSGGGVEDGVLDGAEG
jgi:hypothetical protein